jgi:hypothetical protein
LWLILHPGTERNKPPAMTSDPAPSEGPDIKVELDVSGALTDTVTERFDAGVRLGSLPIQHEAKPWRA